MRGFSPASCVDETQRRVPELAGEYWHERLQALSNELRPLEFAEAIPRWAAGVAHLALEAAGRR